MKLLWATDLHLNHAEADAWSPLAEAVERACADGLILTGDIAESAELDTVLKTLADAIAVPIYFVLGNHDFYGSSIGQTVQRMVHATRDDDRLWFLTDMPSIALADHIHLVGEDGWGDATEGDYESSYVQLNDFIHIDDFSKINQDLWKAKLAELGRICAERLSSKLNRIPTDATDVLVATHVPPFREACWYEGHTTDDNWAPFFVCGAIGRVLRSYAAERPTTRLTVLCGHTHHDGVAQITDNLIVHTGAATYGRPEIEASVMVDGPGVTIRRWSLPLDTAETPKE